jgi:hypothetical protein
MISKYHDAGAVEHVVQSYVAAWTAEDEATRRRLLDAALAVDGTYTDPTIRLAGREALLAHLRNLQARFPGQEVALTSRIDEHHGHVRLGFARRDAAGDVVREGVDFADVGADGRLHRVVGFFGAL